MNRELLDAAEHLLTWGYCVLQDRLPEEQARAMAARFLELHDDPRFSEYNTDQKPYQTLFGMLNHDDRVWDCAFHPDTVAVARHLLGDRFRVVEAASKPSWPGYKWAVAPARRLGRRFPPGARRALDDQLHLDADRLHGRQRRHPDRADEPPLAAEEAPRRPRGGRPGDPRRHRPLRLGDDVARRPVPRRRSQHRRGYPRRPQRRLLPPLDEQLGRVGTPAAPGRDLGAHAGGVPGPVRRQVRAAAGRARTSCDRRRPQPHLPRGQRTHPRRRHARRRLREHDRGRAADGAHVPPLQRAHRVHPGDADRQPRLGRRRQGGAAAGHDLRRVQPVRPRRRAPLPGPPARGPARRSLAPGVPAASSTACWRPGSSRRSRSSSRSRPGCPAFTRAPASTTTASPGCGRRRRRPEFPSSSTSAPQGIHRTRRRRCAGSRRAGPDLRIVIAHLGQPRKQAERGDPEKWKMWQEQIALGRLPNVWFDTASLPDWGEDFPYPAAQRFLEAGGRGRRAAEDHVGYRPAGDPQAPELPGLAAAGAAAHRSFCRRTSGQWCWGERPGRCTAPEAGYLYRLVT